MPALKDYSIFISHRWRYEPDYQRMVRFLNEANNFQWKNFSVPIENSYQGLSNLSLEMKIRRRLGLAHCVVVLSGVYVAHSAWIQKEINNAKAMGKPILGVRPWGAVNMPTAVTLAADEIVGWNSVSIVNGIRRLCR